MKPNVLTTKEELQELYDCSALTIEGLVEESIDEFVSAMLEDGCQVESANIVKGSTMNRVYGLNGNNSYPDDLTIVALTGNFMPVVVKRFSFGGRWFDDIVDNNAFREEYEYAEC